MKSPDTSLINNYKVFQSALGVGTLCGLCITDGYDEALSRGPKMVS